MSSSLFQEIREKRGLAYTVYSSLATFSDTGLFTVYVGTSPKEVGTCLEVMGREFKKLRDTALDRNVLDMLKGNITSAILMNSDSVENRMTSIAKSEMFFGRYLSAEDVIRGINAVKAAEIQKMAKAMFRANQLILCAVGPGSTVGLAQKLKKQLT